MLAARKRVPQFNTILFYFNAYVPRIFPYEQFHGNFHPRFLKHLKVLIKDISIWKAENVVDASQQFSLTVYVFSICNHMRPSTIKD